MSKIFDIPRHSWWSSSARMSPILQCRSRRRTSSGSQVIQSVQSLQADHSAQGRKTQRRWSTVESDFGQLPKNHSYQHHQICCTIFLKKCFICIEKRNGNIVIGWGNGLDPGADVMTNIEEDYHCFVEKLQFARRAERGQPKWSNSNEVDRKKRKSCDLYEVLSSSHT